ncbi:MAG TPA: YdeI/OmpD-associated family protein [Candidatus Dormibacteraeota bacterium]
MERDQDSVPPDFRQALARVAAGLDFEQMAESDRRRYVEWVQAAEEPDARQRRAIDAARMVRDHQDPSELKN